MWSSRRCSVLILPRKAQMEPKRSHIQVQCGSDGGGDLQSHKHRSSFHLFRSFRIVNYTPDLQKSDVDKAVRKALNVWAAVTPLTFKKVYKGIADIMISFEAQGGSIVDPVGGGGFPHHRSHSTLCLHSAEHGDNNPFDGPNLQLAHAYPPGKGIGGDVHFDEAENWTKDSTGWILLESQ